MKDWLTQEWKHDFYTQNKSQIVLKDYIFRSYNFLGGDDL